MKKIKYFIFASLLLCACSARSISIDEARKAVLKDANVSENDVNFSREDESNGLYTFEFSDDNNEYSYTIKSDGTISSRNHNAITKNNDTTDSNNSTTNDNNSTTNNSNSITGNNNSTTNDTTANITEEAAVKKALEAYQLTKDQVTDIDVDHETRNDVNIYEITYDKDNQEYVVEINKANGEIINKYVEKDNSKVS